jgi:LysM repeat protein
MGQGAIARATGTLALGLAVAFAASACDLATPIGPTSSATASGSPAATGSTTSTGPGATPVPGRSTVPAASTDPNASPSSNPGAGPLPTPEQYVVQRGDTLTSIARRFGITVAQLLAANPQVQDPNSIRFGYALTVPPRDSLAVMYRRGGGVIDATDDATDPNDQLTQTPGYADLVRFTVRFEGADVVVELDGLSAPPPLDPDGEELRFIVEMDVTGDLEPDFEVVASNALVESPSPDSPTFGMSLLDRRTKALLTGRAVPGGVSIVDKRLVIRLTQAALGEPRQIAAVARVQRDFYPDGRASPDTVESSVDRLPDQQWPRSNPRWLIILRN